MGTFVAVAVSIGIYFQAQGGAVSGTAKPPAQASVGYRHTKKAEPGVLLSASSLRLDQAQRERLAAIDVLWLAEKRTFAHRMSALVSAIGSPGKDPRSRPELQEYMALSRSYEATRAELWSQCLAELNPEQRWAAAKLAGGGA